MAADVRSTLTLAEARQKCDEKHSCFVKLECTEHMCLPPSYIGRLKEGIVDELDKKLMKFCDNLKAVIVAYDKIGLLQRRGSLVDESPFLHFDVQVAYIVFKPELDSKLIGVVNKFGYDHIGCLVHGCFNAAIAKSQPANGLYSNLSMGSEFRFRVVGLEAVNGVLSISGTIEDKKAGKRKSQIPPQRQLDNASNSFLENPEKRSKQKTKSEQTEDHGTPRKKKKKMHIDTEVASVNNNNNDTQTKPSGATVKRKNKEHSKKRKDKSQTM